MPGEHHTRRLEGQVAEHVVGMIVGVDDEAHRQIGHGADRRQQVLTLAEAAATVDDRHRLPADDEGEVGDAAAVGGREILVGAAMDIEARGHFHDRQRCRRRPGGGEQQARGQPGREPAPHWVATWLWPSSARARSTSAARSEASRSWAAS